MPQTILQAKCTKYDLGQSIKSLRSWIENVATRRHKICPLPLCLPLFLFSKSMQIPDLQERLLIRSYSSPMPTKSNRVLREGHVVFKNQLAFIANTLRHNRLKVSIVKDREAWTQLIMALRSGSKITGLVDTEISWTDNHVPKWSELIYNFCWISLEQKLP